MKSDAGWYDFEVFINDKLLFSEQLGMDMLKHGKVEVSLKSFKKYAIVYLVSCAWVT